MKNDPLYFALEQELICSNLGTLESFPSPEDALVTLLRYEHELGEYVGGEKAREAQKEIAKAAYMEAFLEFFPNVEEAEECWKISGIARRLG